VIDKWIPGPKKPELISADVHVWRAGLDVSTERLAIYDAMLAEDERARAARFRFERDRNHFIAGRGVLREMLGRFLGQPGEALKISYSDYGKPFLPGKRLQFNLAHSGGLALYAFCLDDPVGVDVEVERELSDALQISGRFFSPTERAVLRTLPEEEIIPAFFRCWSRKEAFIKAVGEGLSYPLDAFDVALAPGEPARLVAIRGSEKEARAWSLTSLGLPPGYHGALALKSRNKTLQLFNFKD
jgi:4'-phosphopantetheinyl transferase